MATSYTTLLGLALPVQGELQGTWGDEVNNYITNYLDAAVAGTQNISTDADVTLTKTTGTALTGTSSQYSILLFSGSRAAQRTVTVPAASKSYVVINATTGGFAVKVVGVGPTTGVTIANGEKAVIAWNGSDFIKVSTFGGDPTFGNVTVTGTTTLSNLTASTALALNASKEVVSVTNTGTGNNVLSASPTLTGTISAAALTLSGTTTLSGLTASQAVFTNASKELVSNAITGTGNVVMSASPTLTGTLAAAAATFSGNVTLGDASTDTVQVNGYVGVGGAPSSSATVYAQRTHSGTSAYGVRIQDVLPNAVTSDYQAVFTKPSLSTSTVLTALSGVFVDAPTVGAGASATNYYGVRINDSSVGTNNYGITSLVSAGANKWNIYASGTANNAFAGNVRIGSTTAPTNALDVTGAATFSGNVTLGDATTDTVQVNGYMGVGGAGATNRAVSVVNTALSGTTQSGVVANITGTSGATTGVNGLAAEVGTAAAVFTAADVTGLIVQNASKGAGSTITNQHGVRIADQTQGTNNYGITSLVSSGSNKWNIYASGTANNAFAGNVRIGSTTAPTNALDVTGAMTVSGNTTLGDASTDTVTVNGYMGVGGAAVASRGIEVTSSALTGAGQRGISSTPTATSAATTGVIGVLGGGNTAAAAFTAGYSVALYAQNATKGAGSTITNQHGVYVEDLTSGTNNYGITSAVSSGSNKWNIYASGTAANYFAGQVGIGGTTLINTAHLTISGSGTGSVTGGGILSLFRPSTSAVAGTNFGSIYFTGADTTSNTPTTLAYIRGQASGTHDPGDNPTDLVFAVTADGTEAVYEAMRLNQAGGIVTQPIAGGHTVFNENGVDADFRVESDTNTHALFVQGSDGKIGMGTSIPDSNSKVHVIPESAGSSGIAVGSSGTAAQLLVSHHSTGSIVNIGQLRSSLAGFIGYCVKTDSSVNEAYLSSTSLGIGRSSIEANNGFVRILTGATQTSTYDGAVTLTERLRIDSSGNVQTLTGANVVWAPTPASISTTATLTNANIQAQIINTTGTSYTVTMPLGTTLETLVSWVGTDLGYNFSVINTASGTITMAANTGVTTLGALTIATGTSAQFRIRRTAANTFILYRLS